MSLVRGAVLAAIAVASVSVAGCGGRGGGTEVSSGGGFRLGFPGRSAPAPQADAGIGVNSFLWRATLDTLSFMPLASADPWGGIIITDWYINPEKPDERFKATVYILDTRLRADGLNVSLFKQNRDAAGGWTDAPVSAQTEVDMENAILTRARQLRLSTVGG
jgi:hypothetical protein